MNKTFCLLLVYFLFSIELQAQLIHNFFGEDLMTIRENNSWVVANSIEEISELIIDKESAQAELLIYRFDHNGLPIQILTASVDSAWVPAMGFEPEVEYQFMYIMEDLFLRREANQRNFKGLMRRENIFSEIKYFNYFNRPNFSDGKGLEMSFYFTPGGRPLEITVHKLPNSQLAYHFSYQSNRLNQVIKLAKDEKGEETEVMNAIYEYDRNNRPERIIISVDNQVIRTIGIQYDQRAFPVRKIFTGGGNTFKEVRYFFKLK